MGDGLLKPCAFCGGKAHTYKNNLWHVACENANNGCVTMSAFITEDEAIEEWNKRAAIEYDDFFYLPKPKESLVEYGQIRMFGTEHGCKAVQPVDIIENAVRRWGDELGERIMERIAEVFGAQSAERTCSVTPDFNCSNCGKRIGPVRNCEPYETCDGRVGWRSLDDWVCDVPNYCPNCGAEVVNE